ncbi:MULTISPECIES: SusC/RagA family TonB-linked outer membrane protein [unclassified Chitinophaga]|uniref:SusC/RagA family TonB-linked outer membrane protein n=1 Tax=unclassified Chitinophaga TaxID=2619133 RepID=UPI0009C9D454|nr:MULTISPECIES: SusC/RagA family TonB-linked outer membrane protein [unclassified Chitinophaga]OMP76485.1 hypothetical protein BW716_24520 [[Flexibacter] sp. ATCC 35208]WPV63938.1 SusC/RagA family TonB-linked outer membrane protein [Chitinophaga sp. LS1]
MKGKLPALLLIFLLKVSLLMAQDTRKITGKVVGIDDEPIPGVTVGVVGTSFGTVTGPDGTFSISVPAKTKTLVLRSVGFKTENIQITAIAQLNVVMKPAASDLSEVLVSGAYGTQQSKRSTSYNAQVVTGEQINTIRQSDFSNALAGKVAGLQVRSQSAAKLGSNASILLRGVTGFSTGSDNSPIYIVDGTIISNINSINQDEIQDVSILQGPAAGALYGSRGANGAVVITMKKGAKGNGVGVQVNMGIQVDNVMNLPRYQNEYAGGSSDTLIQYHYTTGQPEAWQALDGKYYHDYADDASWGPKMSGQEYIPWYAWYGGTKYSYKTAALTPQPNNAKSFFNKGITANNSVSFSNNSDKLNFKLAYQNQYIKGMVPTQYQKRNNLNATGTYAINNHFSVAANITYDNTFLFGEVSDGYANATTGSFNQWFHRDLDIGIMKELQNLKTDDGVYASWNHLNPTSYSSSDPDNFYSGNYWYNPYTYLNNVNYNKNTDRIFGNASFTYEVNKDLKFTATYRKQQAILWIENMRSSDLAMSGGQTGEVGYYYTYSENNNKRNIELQGSYNKKIHDFSINAMAGADFYKYLLKTNYAATSGGLSIYNLYTISNSVNTATSGNGRSEEKYRAFFGNLNLGYKNFLFLNATARNDYFSTLPADDNSVFSKSIGGSFVFSEFTKNVLPFLNYGKVRASWGEVPKALGTTSETFGAYRYPGSLYGILNNKWNGNLLMYTNAALVDSKIHGAASQSFELGMDLGFLKDRITIAATYFKTKDKDFPYTVTINGASGYVSMLTNIGAIERSGMEFSLNVIPVSTKNFKWYLTSNWSPLIKNDVEEISKEYNINQTASQGTIWSTSFPSLYHVAGKRWGQLIGGGKAYDAKGRPLVNASGTSFVNNSTYNYGSVLPTHTGGVQNSFTIMKNFTLSFNIDWQLGGKFVSLSEVWGTFSGLTARTAGLNDRGKPKRDAVEDGGGMHLKGYTADGTEVDTYVDTHTYYQNMYNNYIFNDYVYDLTFVKLREISVGYNVPLKKLRLDKVFNSANVSLVARNLWLLYSKTGGDFDPSEIANVYGESANLPGSRSYGMNVTLNF